MRRPLLLTLVWLASCGLPAPSPAQTRDPRASLSEAKKREGEANPAAALEAYKQAVDASSPRSLERARALLGAATLETGLGRYDDSRRHAAEAAQVFERLGNGADASLSWNRQGLSALAAGDYDDAPRLFAAAIERSTP